MFLVFLALFGLLSVLVTLGCTLFIGVLVHLFVLPFAQNGDLSLLRLLLFYDVVDLRSNE